MAPLLQRWFYCTHMTCMLLCDPGFNLPHLRGYTRHSWDSSLILTNILRDVSIDLLTFLLHLDYICYYTICAAFPFGWVDCHYILVVRLVEKLFAWYTTTPGLLPVGTVLVLWKLNIKCWSSVGLFWSWDPSSWHLFELYLRVLIKLVEWANWVCWISLKRWVSIY